MADRVGGKTALGLGATCLVVVSWGLSWWYVPLIRTLGPAQLVEVPGHGGAWLFALWALSGPLGHVVPGGRLGLSRRESAPGAESRWSCCLTRR
jgi:hypothetical protein